MPIIGPALAGFPFILISLLSNYLTLGKVHNFSDPQIPHLQNGRKEIDFAEWLQVVILRELLLRSFLSLFLFWTNACYVKYCILTQEPQAHIRTTYLEMFWKLCEGSHRPNLDRLRGEDLLLL